MLSRQFTTTEKILIVLLIFIFLGGGYYFFVHTSIITQQQSIAAQKKQVEQDIQGLQKKVSEISNMKQELKQLGTQDKSGVYAPAYDNLQSVISMLNVIMPNTTDYSMNFKPTALSDTRRILRRPIEMRFTSPSYVQACQIIDQLHDGPYRCQISQLVVTAEAPDNRVNKEYVPILSRDKVAVSMTITYFETNRE